MGLSLARICFPLCGTRWHHDLQDEKNMKGQPPSASTCIDIRTSPALAMANAGRLGAAPDIPVASRLRCRRTLEQVEWCVAEVPPLERAVITRPEDEGWESESEAPLEYV